MYDCIFVACALFDQGRTSTALAKQAMQWLSPGGKLVLIHVINEVPSYVVGQVPREALSQHQRNAADMLDDIARGISGVQVETMVRSGTPSTVILNTAEKSGADLIMIASHKPGLGDYFIGSTATRVVRHAQCSVLILR